MECRGTLDEHDSEIPSHHLSGFIFRTISLIVFVFFQTEIFSEYAQFNLFFIIAFEFYFPPSKDFHNCRVRFNVFDLNRLANIFGKIMRSMIFQLVISHDISSVFVVVIAVTYSRFRRC